VGDNLIINANWDGVGGTAGSIAITLKDDDFAANQFDWRKCPSYCNTESWSTSLVDIVSGTSHELGVGTDVFITFSSSEIHELNDMWKFVAIGTSTTEAELPTGTSFITSVLRTGESPVGQITIAPGYQGTETSAVDVYKVPPTFAVQMQSMQVMKLVTSLTSPTATSFKFWKSGGTKSPCWDYDDEEATVAEMLRDPVLDLCPTYRLKVDQALSDAGVISASFVGGNNVYSNVGFVATGTSTGSGAKATVTVSGGAVSVLVTLEGTGYAANDVLRITESDMTGDDNHNEYIEFTLATSDLVAEVEGCVSVTRSVDNDVSNVGGYVYHVYYEDPVFAKDLDEAHLKIIEMSGACSSSPTETTEQAVTWTEFGDKHRVFTRESIPLAVSTSPTIEAAFRGLDVTAQKLYKTSGNLWAVTFATALGDISSMSATPTSYLTSGTTVSVYDNVVQGKHPESHVLTGLKTGIDYSVRVAAYTRGTFHGYGNFTDTSTTVGVAVPSSSAQLGLTTSAYTAAPKYTASGTPSEKPPALTGFTASETLQVSEVQDIILGASHLREVQTVTTDASVYAEVQTITTQANNLETISGQMTMRFPEVQTIQLTATDTSEMTGKEMLIKYSYYDNVADTSVTVVQNSVSACVAVDASANDVESLLNGIDKIGGNGVRVVRSGYGGYTDYFGYTWSVTFVGNKVAGNVEPLTVDICDSACANCGTVADPPVASVTTLNENMAVGLNTEVHTVKFEATHPVAQGQYTVKVDVNTATETMTNNAAACLEWNSTALELQNALESMDIVDHVYVERFGDASAVDAAYGNHGYTYSIYYTGNRLTNDNSIGAITDITITILEAEGVCNTFAYFNNGVLTDFAANDAAFTTAKVRETSYTLNSAEGATTSSDLMSAFEVMPTWVKIADVRTSLADDQGGHTWTLAFDESMGNVNQMVCGYAQSGDPFDIAGFACSDKTIIEGNYIGGHFIVNTSKLLSASSTADEMKTALEALTGFGSIAVTRSEVTNQGGYTWTITWLDAIGNQPPLTFANSLTGSGTSITGATLQDGNYLGGTYQLEYQGAVTEKIAYSASASEVDSFLTAIVGDVTVTQGDITTEGGSTYTVTFNALTGDISSLVPYYDGQLTGVGATVKVLTTTQGADATGSALKVSFETPLHCSHSQVPGSQCGGAIDSYSIEIGTSSSNKNQVIPLSASYTVQHIRLSSPELFESLIFDEEGVSGFFKLSYNGAATGPINSGASATDVRDALESLPDINTVDVSRTYGATLVSAGEVTATNGFGSLSCATDCSDFNLAPGELIRVSGLWYKIAYNYDYSKTSFPLALVTDATIATTFGGSDTTTAVYKWSRGFEWSVTFLSTVGDGSVAPLGSPLHGLNPPSSTVSIRPNDCVNCMYIHGLSVWTNYFLSARAKNSMGYGGYVDTQAIPKEVPGAPTYVSSSSVSGSEIRVFFSPPTGDTTDVSQYTVEWDTDPDFAALTAACSETGTCATSTYGRDEVTGAPISVLPPYSYMVQNLQVDTYYVRVAARNSISIANGNNAANSVWSEVVSSTTSDQAPSSPVTVEAVLAGPTQLQGLITKPLSTGGSAITTYKIEWCASSAFNDDATLGSATVAVGSLDLLEDGGNVYKYEVTGLTTGLSYWVRASATNSIGTSSATATSASILISTKPASPASVSLTSASIQDSPITTATLSWSAPSTNGGQPITGYLVEWWEGSSIPEKQVIRFTADYKEFDAANSVAVPDTWFQLHYGPAPDRLASSEASGLPFTIHPANLRSVLMNLDASSVTDVHDYPIGDVEVSKSNIVNSGRAWTVTFISDLNAGDLPLLATTPKGTSSNGDVTVEVEELQAGRRAFGKSEEQILTILATSTASGDVPNDLVGTFQLSFNGTETKTSYLDADASANEVELALEQLPNMRDVTVERNLASANGGSDNGYAWTVTFTGDKGNQPAIAIVSDKLSAPNGVTVSVADGDNSLQSSNAKATNAMPGEFAVGYNSRTLGADVFSFTIDGLVPGETYYASISAINSMGIGAPTLPSTSSVTLPKQIAEPPQNVAVDVHSGSSTTLDVTYDAPVSDGGADITSYRIEVDTSVDFTNPIHTTVNCHPGSTHSVFQITSHNDGAADSHKITDGYFTLDINYNGNTFTTAKIPYDAAAQYEDEVGVWNPIVGAVTTTGTLDCSGVSTVQVTGSDITDLIFEGDRLQFGKLDAGVFVSETTYPDKIYTVLSVTSGTITLTSNVDCSSPSNPVTIFRQYGGRGTVVDSRVACYKEADGDTYGGYLYNVANDFRGKYCPVAPPDDSRLEVQGSMQSKFELIPDMLSMGVKVDRDAPTITNGVTWRVTFLDQSPAGANNFNVAVNSATLTVNGAETTSANFVTVTELVAGEEYTSSCVGTHQVPSSGALVTGQYYWARVFAVNALGMSSAQVSPSSEKPMVVPGAPTAVTLEVVSDTKLRTIFNPPSSDGGDAITSYSIEYSTDSTFSTGVNTHSFTTLSGGAPFSRTLSGLTTGSYYFVRVAACNSRGCSTSTASTPSSLNPHRAPDGPINVLLRTTSHSMVTVSFDAGYNGGDTVQTYRVEWDTASAFNSGSPSPHKGFVDLDASLYNSYTVQYLTTNQQYFVRVMAGNSAGFSVATNASPASAAPAVQIPGKPHSIAAATGGSSGEIDVSFQRPRVPWHLIPCSGTVASPNDCPKEVGGSVASSDGGSSISEYVIEYSEESDFSGYDQGQIVTTSLTVTITNLTPGRTYYIRVAARNQNGLGSFCAFADASCLTAVTAVTAVAKSS
jgi:hypothetical protein